MALDWKTLEYHPRHKPKFPALEMAKNVEHTGARIKMLLGMDGGGPQKGDKAGQFLWSALSDLWTYAANRIPEISDTVVEIDRAMKLGFNWEMGPFELWDAVGVEASVARMRKEGGPIAAECREAAERREDIPGISTIRRPPPAACIGIWSTRTGSRCKFPPASGRSKSRRNRMA